MSLRPAVAGRVASGVVDEGESPATGQARGAERVAGGRAVLGVRDVIHCVHFGSFVMRTSTRAAVARLADPGTPAPESKPGQVRAAMSTTTSFIALEVSVVLTGTTVPSNQPLSTSLLRNRSFGRHETEGRTSPRPTPWPWGDPRERRSSTRFSEHRRWNTCRKPFAHGWGESVTTERR